MAAKPAGSKNPTGARSPMRPVSLGVVLKSMFFFPPTALVARREVEDFPTWAGAKAEAPAKRVVRIASFILIVGVGAVVLALIEKWIVERKSKQTLAPRTKAGGCRKIWIGVQQKKTSVPDRSYQMHNMHEIQYFSKSVTESNIETMQYKYIPKHVIIDKGYVAHWEEDRRGSDFSLAINSR